MLTGTDVALANKLKAAIEAKLTESIGQPMVNPLFLQALCDGIAETLVPWLVQNVQVMPGQSVTGAAGIYPVVAVTSSPGKIR